MDMPQILYPLVMVSVFREDQLLTYWHDAMIINLPDGGTLSVIYRPRQDYIYLVFGLTMGTPRDFPTGDAIISDDYGFWHRHQQMRWHWNPAVESVYNYREPEFLKVTNDAPLELEFINNSGLQIIHDINIQILECTKANWPIIEKYLRGFFTTYFDTPFRKEKEPPPQPEMPYEEDPK